MLHRCDCTEGRVDPFSPSAASAPWKYSVLQVAREQHLEAMGGLAELDPAFRLGLPFEPACGARLNQPIRSGACRGPTAFRRDPPQDFTAGQAGYQHLQDLVGSVVVMRFGTWRGLPGNAKLAAAPPLASVVHVLRRSMGETGTSVLRGRDCSKQPSLLPENSLRVATVSQGGRRRTGRERAA